MQKGGFTLLEIMVVVTLIGLLVSIAIPSYVRTRERSQTNTCISNLHAIDSGIDQWSIENSKIAPDPVTLANVMAYLKKTPVCPASGT
jgi:general secretion pathway protein G